MIVDDLTMVAPYPGLQRRAKLPSGVAAYTERLSTALAGQGVAVKVIAPEVEGEPDRARVDGVTVERSFRRGANALPAAATAARRTGAPIVHLQFETFLYGGPSSVPGVAPALATLRSGGQLPVVTMHQVVDPTPGGQGVHPGSPGEGPAPGGPLGPLRPAADRAGNCRWPPWCTSHRSKAWCPARWWCPWGWTWPIRCRRRRRGRPR